MTTMERQPGNGRRAAAALALLILLLAGYLAAMRATVGISAVNSDQEAAERDLVYLAVHGGLLVIGSAVGFAAGKWVNGLGLAFAVLFVVVLAVAMVGVQVASFELACGAGYNGLIRHWHC
ncbi:MAG: hypothetical protein KatS3mg062_0664 [Tepidiforma sp.]|nr:MAG: hypothetical protein KatS3mg062_0664 [Tepidiforma sp.]